MDVALKKRKGIHYTPPQLAAFLAEQTVESYFEVEKNAEQKQISVLDPACGDGELLVAAARAIAKRNPKMIVHLFGFDLDSEAIKKTRDRLEGLSNCQVQLHVADFLEQSLGLESFDCVISNPPYVRTQVMGGQESQRLADKFKLSGRVDLYHAFAAAISEVLRPGGAMGLLASNRFLTVKSGSAMRELILSNFRLQSVFDLGDTRLFEAAVLPVILAGIKESNAEQDTTFCRVYRSELDLNVDSNLDLVLSSEKRSENVLDLVANESFEGEMKTDLGQFSIERGKLSVTSDSTWTLTNDVTRRWLSTVKANQVCTFGDLAEIKVGIKTTADAVFIRGNWSELEGDSPESKTLFPLITHHDAERWLIEDPVKSVLYPYQMDLKKRTVIDLADCPNAKSYFESHRERLAGRKYLIEGGREWFEIWVPHQPATWAAPKIVWPDISEQPKFFLDESGAIVNGDCYWIKLREGVEADWLYMMLAVANSTVAVQFYDTVFHNKLYAGRRRFMTQYVKAFPLPDIGSKAGKKIVSAVRKHLEKPSDSFEKKIETMVQKVFGF